MCKYNHLVILYLLNNLNFKLLEEPLVLFFFEKIFEFQINNETKRNNFVNNCIFFGDQIKILEGKLILFSCKIVKNFKTSK